MPVKRTLERPTTTQAAVLVELRRSILSGQIAPGSQILQNELAARCGVSRAPLRNAMRSLEGQGLIRYSSHRGYYVTEIDLEELAELSEIREVIETDLLRSVAGGITETTINRMAASIDAMRVAEREQDWAEWLSSHRTFHFTLFEASGRTFVTRILSQLWDLADLYRSYYMRTRISDARDLREHKMILEAARIKDVDRLEAVMVSHRGGTVESIESSLIDEGR